MANLQKMFSVASALGKGGGAATVNKLPTIASQATMPFRSQATLATGTGNEQFKYLEMIQGVFEDLEAPNFIKLKDFLGKLFARNSFS